MAYVLFRPAKTQDGQTPPEPPLPPQSASLSRFPFLRNYRITVVLSNIRPPANYERADFNIKDTTDEAIQFFKQEVITEDEIFPKIFSCPVCSKRLKATKSGRFRCSECKTILAIDNQGEVFLA